MDYLTYKQNFILLTGLRVDEESLDIMDCLNNPTNYAKTAKQLQKIQAVKEFTTYKHYNSTTKIISTTDAANYAIAKLWYLQIEKLIVLHLNARSYKMGESIFTGTTNETTTYPREIVRDCIKFNSTQVVLMHNHPGGSKHPSMPDINMTTKVKEILKVIGVKVVDHIIVNQAKEYYSFMEEGTFPHDC
jgi:DNA repair protein RadC